MALARDTHITLYDRDYALWLEDTVSKLRDRDYDNIDWDNLLDEIESMGKRDRRSLKSRLRVVILHLLKWEAQPEMRTGSWRGSIIENRERIEEVLADSPSLKNCLAESIAACYAKAREIAAAETNLPIDVFPLECPYSVEEIRDDEFFPEN